jgi:hypothetical protein
MKTCDFCKEVKLIQFTDEEHDLCLCCLEGLQINWLEAIEYDAYSLEACGIVDDSKEKRIIGI